MGADVMTHRLATWNPTVEQYRALVDGLEDVDEISLIGTTAHTGVSHPDLGGMRVVRRIAPDAPQSTVACPTRRTAGAQLSRFTEGRIDTCRTAVAPNDCGLIHG